MKKLMIIFVLALFSCNSEDANDCFQTAGNIIEKDIEVGSFQRILVNRDITLFIVEGSEYKVTIETGVNLINDVSARVIGDRLVLTDNNTCNWVREYGITKITVTTPTLREIRSSSQYTIHSEGILAFPNLTLISEDFNEDTPFTVGDFNLQINANQLHITSNNISSFYISGSVNDLRLGFFSGSGRFEGEDLIAQNVEVSHRGSNDMIVNPQQSLTGIIRGTGNVISLNQPPVIEVEEIYIGALIFEGN